MEKDKINDTEASRENNPDQNPTKDKAPVQEPDQGSQDPVILQRDSSDPLRSVAPTGHPDMNPVSDESDDSSEAA